jgi:hypothetical protein
MRDFDLLRGACRWSEANVQTRFGTGIKAHNLIDVKTPRWHPESNGIVERFNGTVRDESDN